MAPTDQSRPPPGAFAHIEALGLERHPEGGWYRRVWVHPVRDHGGRALASSIHYLLAEGERSHWHRIDATETWCWHAGQPLRLSTSIEGHEIDEIILGPDLSAGQQLQVTVEPDCWQSADLASPTSATGPGDGDGGAEADRPAGFALVSCLVVPEFRFDGFEMAPPDWSPT